MTNQGKKFDGHKPRFDLVDPYFHEDLAQILTHGAGKYGEDNWQLVDEAIKRYTAALERHVNAFKKGIFIDPDSGLHQMSCVAANAMFLHFLTRKRDANNRSQSICEAAGSASQLP